MDLPNGQITRFADDVVCPIRTPEDGNKVEKAVREFLAPRGLAISEEKMKKGDIRDGLTILGFTIIKIKGDVQIRPKEESVSRFITGLHDHIASFIHSQRELIETLNRKLRGWAGYYRNFDAFDAFRGVDTTVHTALLESAISRHPQMQLKKLQDRYWYMDNAGSLWYSLPNDRSVKVIHLADTILLAPRRKLTSVNPYFERNHLKEQKR